VHEDSCQVKLYLETNVNLEKKATKFRDQCGELSSSNLASIAVLLQAVTVKYTHVYAKIEITACEARLRAFSAF